MTDDCLVMTSPMQATKQKLSVTVITLNEEERIRDCLESVRWADELRLGFLDGTRGLIIGMIGAFHAFHKQAKLWALSQKEHGAGEDRPERQEL